MAAHSPQSLRLNTFIAFGLPALVVAAIAATGYALFFSAYTTDWRMAMHENIDSYGCVRVLMEMVETHNFIAPRSPFIAYGTFYYYVSYIVWLFRALFSPQTIDVLSFYMAERWASFLGLIASLAVYFPLQKRLRLPAWFPYVAIFSTITLWEIFYYSFFPKPETLQYVFLLLTLLAVADLEDDKTPQSFYVACVFAGLASAAKVFGIFYLPILLGTDALKAWRSVSERKHPRARAFAKEIFSRWIVGLVLFAGIYLLLNLRWLIDFQYSLDYYAKQRAVWNANHERFSLAWLSQLQSFGTGMLVFYSIGFVGALRRLPKTLKKNSDFEAIDGIILFLPLYLFYLIATVHADFSQRYLMPAFPGLLLGATQGIEQCASIVSHRIRARHAKALLTAGLLVLVLWLDRNRYETAFAHMKDFRTYEQSDRARAGRWLAQQYPPETSIFFYFNWWVPAVFQNTQNLRHCPFTVTRINQLDPDVVLLIDGVNDKCAPLIEAFRSGQTPYHLAADLPEDPRRAPRYLVFERNTPTK